MLLTKKYGGFARNSWDPRIIVFGAMDASMEKCAPTKVTKVKIFGIG